MILAIDPGPTDSAYVCFTGHHIVEHAKVRNEVMLERLHDRAVAYHLVIEQIASFGMAVGSEVFETVFWSGRFAEAWAGPFDRLKRHEIKTYLCGSMRAKDANIRQALIDRFGGSLAIGKKKSPGPLYGLSGDQWSALAIAVTWWDRHHCNSLREQYTRRGKDSPSSWTGQAGAASIELGVAMLGLLVLLIPIIAFAWQSFSVIVVSSLRHERQVVPLFISRPVYVFSNFADENLTNFTLAPIGSGLFVVNGLVKDASISSAMPNVEFVNVIDVANQPDLHAGRAHADRAAEPMRVNVVVDEFVRVEEESDVFRQSFVVFRNGWQRLDSVHKRDVIGRDGSWRVPVILDPYFKKRGRIEFQSWRDVRNIHIGALDGDVMVSHLAIDTNLNPSQDGNSERHQDDRVSELFEKLLQKGLYLCLFFSGGWIGIVRSRRWGLTRIGGLTALVCGWVGLWL